MLHSRGTKQLLVVAGTILATSLLTILAARGNSSLSAIFFFGRGHSCTVPDLTSNFSTLFITGGHNCAPGSQLAQGRSCNFGCPKCWTMSGQQPSCQAIGFGAGSLRCNFQNTNCTAHCTSCARSRRSRIAEQSFIRVLSQVFHTHLTLQTEKSVSKVAHKNFFALFTKLTTSEQPVLCPECIPNTCTTAKKDEVGKVWINIKQKHIHVDGPDREKQCSEFCADTMSYQLNEGHCGTTFCGCYNHRVPWITAVQKYAENKCCKMCSYVGSKFPTLQQLNSTPADELANRAAAATSITSSPSNTKADIAYRGRMANQMIQHLFGSLYARRCGYKLMGATDVLSAFDNTQSSIDPEDRSSAKQVAGFDMWHQFYLNFNHVNDRKIARALFHMTGTFQTPLGPHDIVIHVREFEERRAGILTVPLLYFSTALGAAISSDGGNSVVRKIWIIAETNWKNKRSNAIVAALKKKFGAVLHDKSAAEDMELARRAPIFIGSFGTFSWIIVYLRGEHERTTTECRVSKVTSRDNGLQRTAADCRGLQRAHMPFSRNRNDTGWVTSCHLFIHDDPRITMWDLSVISAARNGDKTPMHYNAVTLLDFIKSGEFHECAAVRKEFDIAPC